MHSRKRTIAIAKGKFLPLCWVLALTVACPDFAVAQAPPSPSPVPVSASPETPAPVPVEPKAKSAPEELTLDEIISRALTAYGGKDALSALEANSTTFGKQIVGDGSEPLVYRCARKGNKWRIDLESSSENSQTASAAITAGAKAVSTSTAFDGVSGWQQIAGGELSTLSPDKLVWLNEQQLRQPTLLAYWQDKDHNFVLRGKTQYKQVPVYAVEVSTGSDKPTTLYLDQSNYQVVALSYDVDSTTDPKSGPERSSVFVEYSEYRPSAGTSWPFKQEQTVNGKGGSQLELDSVDIATPVDLALFNRPSNGTSYRISRPVSIGFDYSQKEILVKGRINGSEEMDFILDTGASETIIDRRVAAEYFLAKQGQYDIAAISGLITARTSVIKRLELGNLIMDDVQARIFDLMPQSRQLGKQIAGIIGTNVINKFLVTIDYGKPAVIFSDIDGGVRPVHAAAVPFTQKESPFVKVRFNGKDDQVLLVDTGAAFNHIPTAVAQKYVGADPANVRHFTEGTGLDGRPIRLATVVVDSVAIAGQPVRKVSFTYPYSAEPKGLPNKATREGGFFEDSRLGILGNPFWQNFILTIDYKFQRLLLQANPVVKLRADIEQALTAGDTRLVVYHDYKAAELFYQKALMFADTGNDVKEQGRLLGRLGSLRRVMAKELSRPEHAKAAYDFFVKGEEKALKVHAQDVQGRILADWSLLYSDNSQTREAKLTIDRAMQLAPQDPMVNVDCAVQLYRAKQFPDMQKYVEKALFLDPSNWQALWFQVKLSETFFDTPRVVATLKEILRFYPWSKLAQDKLKNLTVQSNPAPASPTNAPGQPKVSPSPAATPSQTR